MSKKKSAKGNKTENKFSSENERKSPAFQFYPKQWLGDDKIMLMDWEAKGIHIHLMCIAWQQEPPCTLPDNDSILKKLCNNPENWDNLKPQIFNAWKRKDGRWIQQGLYNEYLKQKEYRESRSANAKSRWKKEKARAKDMQSTSNALLSSSSLSPSSSTPSSPTSSGEDIYRDGEKIPPDMEIVKAHFVSQGYTEEDAEKFWYHHDSKGWLIGSGRMINWQSAVVTWLKTKEQYGYY